MFEVSDRGSRGWGGGTGPPEPAVLLKLPAKPGDTWTEAHLTWTVWEAEVEVPAGKSTAIPVSTELEVPGEAGKRTVWFAPGVGMVKTVTTAFGIDRTTVLKSFTPGT